MHELVDARVALLAAYEPTVDAVSVWSCGLDPVQHVLDLLIRRVDRAVKVPMCFVEGSCCYTCCSIIQSIAEISKHINRNLMLPLR